MLTREQVFALIPAGYDGVRHFAITNLLAFAVILPSLWGVRGPSPRELFVVPGAFLFASFGEWALHKHALHRPVRGLRVLYDRHTLHHHAAFHHDSMAAPSPREWRWVLFPVGAIVGVVALAAPIAGLLALTLSRNAGLLFLATAGGFYLLYEWCHLSYHQSPESAVGRIPLVRILRRHHQRHHDPSLMARYNFNITFPIWDLLAGTMAPRPSRE